MRLDANFGLLLLCFFLSGLAGLVYETAWTREFSFVFGTSSLAVATVLAAYMAGLAAGAALAARLADRITRPILAYGLLELGIALAALAIPGAIALSRALYVGLFGGLDGLPEAGGLSPALFYTACSFVILMVPTAMMGATLPLLARHAVRREEEIAGRVGILYAVNTAGAVAGTLVAAYVLLPQLGLRQTIWAAAGVNGAVFLAAGALARRAGPMAPVAARPGVEAEARGGRWVLPLILASGAASFSYEVMWVRLLEHVMDASVYAFAAMLASFLVGIAGGSALASRWGSTRERAALGFAIAQIATAALSLAAFAASDGIPSVVVSLRQLGSPKLIGDLVVSMLVLTPAALCIGATFPFAVRVLARDETEASSASARIYTWNTLGSILGSLGTGFFLLPWIGFVGTVSLCAGLNLLLAAAAGATLPRARLAVAGAAGFGLLLLLLARPAIPWQVVSFAFHRKPELIERVAYFGTGRTATVLMSEAGARWMLTSNGLFESTIDGPLVWHGYATTEHWMGALPVLARPGMRSMLVIGLGGGVTLESIPPSVEHVDVVELEPEVVAANRSIGERRWRDPLADPRVRLHLNDARNALVLTEQRFGAIVSQPSHPWIGGAANLYTNEFFELARSRLTEDGVLVQWMGLEFLDEALFRTLVATLRSVFPNVRVYLPPPGASVLFLASSAPLDLERTAAEAIAANREAFAEIGITIGEDVTAHLLLDEQGSLEVAEGAALNRDHHNLLRNEVPKLRPEQQLVGRMDELYAPRDPLTRWDPSDSDPFQLLARAPARRAARLAGHGSAVFRMQMLDDPVELEIARAAVGVEGQEGGEWRDRLREALQEAPRHAHGRAALLRSAREKLAGGGDPLDLVTPPLDAAESAVVRGWRDAETAAGLERELASIDLRHPLYRDAQRLRAGWRADSGDRERALEAVAIVDRLAPWNAEDLLLRARACLAAGDALATLDTLKITTDVLLALGADKGQIRRTRLLLDEVPVAPELQVVRDSVLRQVQLARRQAAEARTLEAFGH